MPRSASRWSGSLTSGLAAVVQRLARPDEPNRADEGQDDEHGHGGKQGEGADQDRLTLHPRRDFERRALLALAERLFPDNDVAALDGARRRVVKRDLARQVQPHRDEFAAVPTRIAGALPCGRAHHLRVLEQAILLLIAIS